MKTFDEIKKTLRNYHVELREKFHVTEIGFFGSYVRGEQTEKSDIRPELKERITKEAIYES